MIDIKKRLEEQIRTIDYELKVELPKEIKRAREYGDLRENAEYETARHQQRILMQRQAELERDLAEVKPTDFAGFPSDRAGMGTTVTIRRPDGKPQRLIILGEWDRDDALGVISSGSRLAQLLEGRRAGETVDLPGASGDEPCTLVQVTGLTGEIRKWASGD